MQSVRDFRLVLCADVSECMVEHALETLEHIVKGRLDHLLYKPLIVSERRTLRTRRRYYDAGWSKKWPVLATAL